MKKTILKALAIVLLPLAISCGETKSTENTEQATETPAESPKNIAAKAAAGKMDPICEMDRDTSWTDYSVYKGDTIWFCGEGCKQAFEARPEKYMGKS